MAKVPFGKRESRVFPEAMPCPWVTTALAEFLYRSAKRIRQSRAKALEKTIARATGPDTNPDRVHATRTVSYVRVALLVLVNSTVSATANVMYAEKRPLLSSG